MTAWEKKITDAFINHYFAFSAAAEDKRSVLRLRSSVFFPDFDSVSSDEKESYLEAAETLERKGVIKLRWLEKKERLKTLSCENFEKLFLEAGRLFPKNEAEEIRASLEVKLKTLKESPSAGENIKKLISVIEYLSRNFGPHEIGQGIDNNRMKDLIRLLEYCSEPAGLENITARALSIQLYQDSKKLERLLAVCKPLLSRAEKIVNVPDFTIMSPQIVRVVFQVVFDVIRSGSHIL